MKDKMGAEDFLAKVEWEGGILEAIEYGLSAEQLEDSDSALGKAWKEIEIAYSSMEKPMRFIESLLEGE